MPAVEFTLRWPDGVRQHCSSPSTAVHDFLSPGAVDSVAGMVARCGAAMDAASERVRARYGFACTGATAQQAAIARAAARYDSGCVVVHSVGGQTAPPLPATVPVAVIGGGQAGLSVSWHLIEAGIDHVVLERARAFHTWHEERWDAFTLVTPNFQCRLPGNPYDGDDPDGFMTRSEVVAYLQRFRDGLDPPLHEGVDVRRLSRGATGDFVLDTSAGTVRAGQVVLAVGGYHVPAAPPLALPAGLETIHSRDYRNPGALAPGAVLVVGTGQSGAQIAEDLHLAGREVHLCVGSAPRCARRYRGRDVVSWLEDMGHYDVAVGERPDGAAVHQEANHYVTGRAGGHDLDLRAFAAQGMRLHGRLTAIESGVATFADDLEARLDAADETYNRINRSIDRWIDDQRIAVAAPPSAYTPVWRPAAPDVPLDLQAAGVGAVVWCTGFRPAWDWVDCPGFLAVDGHPAHERGVVRAVPGLSVVGLPWLHTWGSGRFAAIARDAAHVVEHVGVAVGATASS